MQHVSKPLVWLTLIAASALGACNSAPPRPDAALQVAALPGPHCRDFDRLTLGQRYNVGDTFVGQHATIFFRSYSFNGAQYANGFGFTNNTVIVNSTPPEYKPYVVATEVVPNTPAQRVRFKFGEILQGLHSNFAVNGSPVQEGLSLADFDGQLINGVQVSVTLNPVPGKNTGTVELTAVTRDITSVTFGGRSLYIDDFCTQ